MYDRMQGTNYVSFNSVNGREFINLNRNLTETEDTSNVMNILHTQIASLNKKSLKNITNLFK